MVAEAVIDNLAVGDGDFLGFNHGPPDAGGEDDIFLRGVLHGFQDDVFLKYGVFLEYVVPRLEGMNLPYCHRVEEPLAELLEVRTVEVASGRDGDEFAPVNQQFSGLRHE